MYSPTLDAVRPVERENKELGECRGAVQSKEDDVELVRRKVDERKERQCQLYFFACNRLGPAKVTPLCTPARPIPHSLDHDVGLLVVGHFCYIVFWVEKEISR